MAQQVWTAPAVARLSVRLTSFLQGYLRDRARDVEIEDVVQEALLRTWASRDRLEPDGVASFALVTARNLALSQLRTVDAAERARERLPLPEQPQSPQDRAEQMDRIRILAEALEGLTPQEKEALLSRDVHGVALTELGQATDQSTGALAAQLTRARARLRVNYVLAAQRVALPTRGCRPVLLALSAADKRRMRETRAMAHVAECETCAALSQPLSERRLPAGWLIPGLAPMGGVDASGGWAALVRRLSNARTATVGAVGAVVVAAAAIAFAAQDRMTQQPAPAVAVAPTADRPTPSPPASSPGRRAGDPMTLDGALVLAVPADEGFWVQDPDSPGAGRRLWVALRTGGSESPTRVRAGDRVDAAGTLVRTPDGHAARMGVTPQEGAAELMRQPLHLLVDDARLRVRPRG